MLKWFKRVFLLLIITGLIGLNILTLTSQVAFAALSGLVGSVGLVTNSMRFNNQRTAMNRKALRQKASMRAVKQRALRRTKRLAAYQVIEVSASYLPVAGAAIIVGGSLWELKQHCDGLMDFRSIPNLGTEEDERNIMESVCNPQLPGLPSAWTDYSIKGSYESTLTKLGFSDTEELASEMPTIKELQTAGEETNGYRIYLAQAQNYWDSLPDVSELFKSDEETTDEANSSSLYEQTKTYMQELLTREQ